MRAQPYDFKYIDVSQGKGFEDMEILLFCDASPQTQTKGRSQLGYVVGIVSKTNMKREISNN